MYDDFLKGHGITLGIRMGFWGSKGLLSRYLERSGFHGKHHHQIWLEIRGYIMGFECVLPSGKRLQFANWKITGFNR